MEHTNEHLYFLNSLYRDFILPTILGSEDKEILYWAGKHVSRKYDLSDIDDLIEFFDMAQFGTLKVLKDRKHTAVFELSGQVVTDRLDSQSDEFSLESGIIAECLERQNGTPTEASATITKKHVVQITSLCALHLHLQHPQCHLTLHLQPDLHHNNIHVHIL